MKLLSYRQTLLHSAIVASLLPLSAFAQNTSTQETVELDEIKVVAAKQALLQALGSSVITSEALEKQPVVNDISEMVRRMPGVNLTANTTSGNYGNKRQIDIRGMGPENTLILIDGIPVSSRQSQRMMRTGERNSRGDSNWVPAEAIEKIEVLRGPAATRYGSGAMGGVVNIVTKETSNELHGSVTYHTNQPEDDQEGASNRIGFNISGPIVDDQLTFRVYGSYNKTESDALDINGASGAIAGKEGVRNKDIAGRLQWKINENQKLTFDSSFSRQGNIYNGETPASTTLDPVGRPIIGDETSRMYRSAFSLTHDGNWDWGKSKTSLSYDQTVNSRYKETLGGRDGLLSNYSIVDTDLKNYRFSSQFDIPINTGITEQVLTLGVEANRSAMNDPHTMSHTINGLAGYTTPRSGKTSLNSYAIFAEDNIYFPNSRTEIIPTLRFDYSNTYGSNISPGLNFSQAIGENWKIKGGIARGYKTPNLYQGNPNYLSQGNGTACPVSYARLNCYVIGNPDLKPETSINKEIGIEYNNEGYQGTLTYFHNDYRNKINSTVVPFYTYTSGRDAYNFFKWENASKAVVSGLEGNIVIPVLDNLDFSSNFTYMIESKNKSTGNPLSIIPKYTINSSINWRPNDDIDVNLSHTFYGRQTPPKYAERWGQVNNVSTEEVGAYGLWSANVGYRFSKNFDARIGVNNIFDKHLYRSTGGARTYNESGRAYYATLRASF